MKLISLLAASAAIILVPASSALAQRQPPTPEQRIDRLERQVDELQRRLFPKGRPADTAGFADDPAATQSSVMSLDQRLDALERQMADMLRQSEDNGNRLRGIENGLGQLKTDEDQRIQTLEQRMSAAEAAATAPAPTATTPAEVVPGPKPRVRTPAQPPRTAAAPPPAAAGDEGLGAAATDPGEDAYTEGFHLWQAGKYDESISTLQALVKAYPKHRRVSYANNLIGRAELDKGDARTAAATLLANYRDHPGGDRAPDSLFYLGQALMQLGQPAQACKAYAELDAVYGAKVRPDLKKLETDAKAQANCG
ncbi:MAG TPA: tetratricopeptide repeat protein [Sphingomicrobium sp.]|nr:tetratricopeptide repeat protein [Sphingomicrobium sp.]